MRGCDAEVTRVVDRHHNRLDYMATSALKKVHAFERISEWSVINHGAKLYINVEPRQFNTVCSLDVEDNESGQFVGIGIYDGETAYYWSNWELAKQLTIPKFVAHNGISDVKKLQAWGFHVDESWILWDTQLMAHVIDSSRKAYGLKKLVKEDLGIEYPSYEEICGKKGNKNHKTLADFPVEAVAEYNGCDTYCCYRLFQKQMEKISVK